jgi:hypothetical protein
MTERAAMRALTAEDLWGRLMTALDRIDVLEAKCAALQDRVLALDADKDVLMDQGESIARERDRMREQMVWQEHRGDTAEARVAALTVPLCVGSPIISTLARDGQWISEDGRGLVAADDLFQHDPYARIAALRRYARALE